MPSSSRSARELFAKSRGINLLSAARVALFGARYVWFVVGVPGFLSQPGMPFTPVGSVPALFTHLPSASHSPGPALRRPCSGWAHRARRI